MQFLHENTECLLIALIPSDSFILEFSSSVEVDLKSTVSWTPMLEQAAKADLVADFKVVTWKIWNMRRRSYEDAVAGEERLREREGELK